jgi:hypothetical protein
MKSILSLTLAVLLVLPAHAGGRRSSSYSYGTGSKTSSQRVTGHWKPSAGKYVMPHRRSTVDRTQFNNWSTRGNYNLYTGQPGTKIPKK